MVLAKWLPVPCLRQTLADTAAGLTKLALSHAALVAAGTETATDLTEAQKEHGRYKKGRVSWKGLPILIENPAGSYRSGTSKNGTKWRQLMRDHYGFFGSTESKADGDAVDVFLREGGDLDSEIVFVVNQAKQDGTFDEHKVIAGVSNEAEARATYLRNYEKGWRGLKSITALTLAQLKWWLEFGDTGKEIKDGHFAANVKKKSGVKAAALAVCPSCEKFATVFKVAADATWLPRIYFIKRARARDEPFTICVDLDGTLATELETHDPEKIGPPRQDAKRWMDAFKKAKARVIIWTVRGNTALVEAWLKEHAIPYDHVNENPAQPEGTSGKIIADCYWDNRAIDATDLETGHEVLRRLEAAQQDDAPEEREEPKATRARTTIHILLGPADILQEALSALL